jgi:hypothetical protein
MAFIECPECKHAVSDRAAACPSCGLPMTAFPRAQSSQESHPPEVSTVSPDAVRHPRAIWKWFAVLSTSLIASTFLQLYEHGHISISPVGLGSIVGGALPSFAVAMLFAIFPRGYAGIIVGVVIVIGVAFLEWLGISFSR